MPNFLLPISVSYQVGGYYLYTHTGKSLKVVLDRLNMGPGISPSKTERNRLAVQDDAINKIAARVLIESPYMARSRKIDCLAGLPHQIHEVDLQGRGLLNGLRNADHDEVRDHARVARSGTHRNQISIFNRVN